MENGLFPRWMIKTLGMLLIIFVAMLILNQLKAITQTRNPQTMNISAQGKISSVPDAAIVRIGVATEGVDMVAVKNENNRKMNQVIAFIKQQGVNQNDIQTTELSAAPKYNYVNGQNNLVGYQASQMVTVKFYDVDKSRAQLEKVVDGVVNNGANQIQGVNFSFSHPDNLRQQARKLAIERAKKRAEELTSEAGVRLGRVINIVDAGDVGSPMPMMMNFAREKSVAPDIQPGTQDVIENVTLVFEVD